MAEQPNINTNWVEEIFAQNESAIFNKMQAIIQKKQYVSQLKSKIRASEEQKYKLKEYIASLETIVRKSKNYELLDPNLTNEIEEAQSSIVNVKKEIALLESKNNTEKKATEDKTLISSMRKILSELYTTNFDSIKQKENTLLELKKEIDEFNSIFICKEKVDLDNYLKERDLLKAKNMRLKEMLSMIIKQKI